MNKVMSIVVIVLCLAAYSNSQTATDFNVKYPVVTAYEVRPGILMTPRYTAEDEVCEMWFQKQNGTISGTSLDSHMSDVMMKSVIEELVHSSVRGK